MIVSLDVLFDLALVSSLTRPPLTVRHSITHSERDPKSYIMYMPVHPSLPRVCLSCKTLQKLPDVSFFEVSSESTMFVNVRLA